MTDLPPIRDVQHTRGIMAVGLGPAGAFGHVASLTCRMTYRGNRLGMAH
jgi:hypothetical protein